jgi:hypothetical protein
VLYECSDAAINDSPHAYIHSWTRALSEYGRMPRVEAHFNKEPQKWTELENLPFTQSGVDLTTLMDAS